MRACPLVLFTLLTGCFVKETDCFDLAIDDRIVAPPGTESVQVTVGLNPEVRSSDVVELETTGVAEASLERTTDAVVVDISCMSRPGDGTVSLSLATRACTATITVDCPGDGTPKDKKDKGPKIPRVLGFPKYMTDCMVDGDGCVHTDSKTCDIVLNEALGGDGANVTVTGTLIRSSTLGVIEVGAYTAPDKITTAGPGAGLSRTGSTLTRSVFGDYAFSPLVTDTVSVPKGDLDVTFLTTVDRVSGDILLDTDITGVRTEPLEATAKDPPEDDQAIVTLKQARVCGIAIGKF